MTNPNNLNIVEETTKLNSIHPYFIPDYKSTSPGSSVCFHPFAISSLPISALKSIPSLTEIILPSKTKLEITQESLLLPIQKVTAVAPGLPPASLAAMLFIPTVTRLDLSGNTLSTDHWDAIESAKHKIRELRVTGATSPVDLSTIKGLVALEILSISSADIGAGIGSAIAHGLVELILRDTQLGIPGLQAICQLNRLKRLNIGRNWLLGAGIKPGFDFGNIKDTLVELVADEIGLESEGLGCISQFRCLEVLNLGYNRVGKAINDGFDFGNLKKTLRELNICATGLEWCGLRHVGLQMEAVERLKASWNPRLAASMPDDFSFGNLRDTAVELGMWYTGFGQRGFKDLTQFRGISLMVIKDAESFGEAILGDFSFGNLKDTLRELRIFDSKLTPAGLVKLGELKALETLSIEFNSELEILADLNTGRANLNIDLGHLKDTLSVVEMSACGVKYDLLRALSDCRKVRILRISYNESLGASLPADFDLKYLKDTLEELQVDSCGIGEAGLRAIADCRRLWILYLGGNEAVGEALANGFDMRQLKETLRVLSVAGCNVTPAGLMKVLECRKLVLLNLRENEELGGSALAGCAFDKSERMSSVELNGCGVDAEAIGAVKAAFPMAYVKH